MLSVVLESFVEVGSSTIVCVVLESFVSSKTVCIVLESFASHHS